MEDKMDGVAAAAKKARLIAERVLPARPHHLTLQPGRKYTPPSGFWFTGTSSRLQYLTNLSDADRGMLMTVPFFEIMDEDQPADPVKAVVRGEVKKKMSIKDYKNKKKSTSPTENDFSVKSESKQAGAIDTKTTKVMDKGEDSRPKETNGLHPAKLHNFRATAEVNGDRSVSQPKHDAPNPPTLDSRKRPPEPDETIQPHKKLKAGDSTTRLDPGRDPKLGAPQSRDVPKDRAVPRELKDAKDAKAVTPSEGANGRLQVSGDRDKDLSSPRSTILVNGARSRAGSSTPTSRKGDKGEASKTSIPPLLSPPFQMEIGEESTGPRKRPAGKAPLKVPKTVSHSRTNSAAKPPIPDLLSPIHLGLDASLESSGKKTEDKMKAKATKRPKIPIPPLLSPTLPPAVEADLIRNPPPKAVPISQSSGKKTKSPAEAKELPHESGRRSRVVTLKYKKALKARVQAILSLPSKSRREALRKERSASVERTPPARKRALTGSDVAVEVPFKRSRPSGDALPARPAAPTTPLKNSATSMIRALSNNSQANTPGDSTGLTPGAAERPPTSSESLDPGVAARCAVQRERHAKYTRLGSKLKHTKDDIVRRRDPSSLSEGDQKRAAALHLEMILSYMIAFKAFNQSRALERRPLDINMWETLLPHFAELRMRTHRSRPLQALAAQINALCLEEFSQAFTSLDERSAGGVFSRWVRYAKKRREMWEEARTLLDQVPDDKMKANLGPWNSVDDAVSAALLILRRWANQDRVDWKAELEVPVSVNGA